MVKFGLKLVKYWKISVCLFVYKTARVLQVLLMHYTYTAVAIPRGNLAPSIVLLAYTPSPQFYSLLVSTRYIVTPDGLGSGSESFRLATHVHADIFRTVHTALTSSFAMLCFNWTYQADRPGQGLIECFMPLITRSPCRFGWPGRQHSQSALESPECNTQFDAISSYSARTNRPSLAFKRSSQHFPDPPPESIEPGPADWRPKRATITPSSLDNLGAFEKENILLKFWGTVSQIKIMTRIPKTWTGRRKHEKG